MLQTAKTIVRDKPVRRRFLDPATITHRFYGMVLKGHCLDPIYKDGETVVFDREAKVENGCFANFYYRREAMKPGHLNVALKKLVIAPPYFIKLPWEDNPNSTVVPVIIVEQMNPKGQWSVLCRDLLAVHRCIGRVGDPEVEAYLDREWQS